MWKTWKGGNQPRDTEGRAVEYRLRNGEEYDDLAETLFWEHGWDDSPDFDIVAYRVLK